MFTARDFEKINGFSNFFWAWGAEDDNLLFRIAKHKMSPYRNEFSRYKMIPHQDIRNIGGEQAVSRKYRILELSKNLTREDGLNSLQYVIKGRIESKLFTLIKVDLRKSKNNLTLDF